jgi:hypothetical protein
MTPDAAERLRVYQEGQHSARTEDAECPYRQSDWRSRTWSKGRVRLWSTTKPGCLKQPNTTVVPPSNKQKERTHDRDRSRIP